MFQPGDRVVCTNRGSQHLTILALNGEYIVKEADLETVTLVGIEGEFFAWRFRHLVPAIVNKTIDLKNRKIILANT